MIALLAAALLLAAPMTDSIIDASAAAPTFPVASDSEAAAKLEAVQRAWDGDSAARSGEVSAPRTVGSTVVQILASLALLAGLAVTGFVLVRKVRRAPGPGRGRGGSLLDVLESRPLGQGNAVTLVRVHDRVLAVGHGPGGVSALAEFHGAEAAGILAETGDGAVSVRDFSATLDTFLDRFRTSPQAPARRDEEAP